jgi:hypothetical protein
MRSWSGACLSKYVFDGFRTPLGEQWVAHKFAEARYLIDNYIGGPHKCPLDRTWASQTASK